jgi:hypothetical protein
MKFETFSTVTEGFASALMETTHASCTTLKNLISLSSPLLEVLILLDFYCYFVLDISTALHQGLVFMSGTFALFF